MLDHRANGDLCLGEKLLDGVGQQVRGGVTNDLQAIGILGRHDGQRRVFFHAVTGVHQAAIDLARQGRFGQTGANRGGHFRHGDRARKFALGAVRQCDVKHGVVSLQRKSAVVTALG